MIDLLALIHTGEISREEAERIFDETIEAIHCGISPSQWWETLGLSQYEATAYAHGGTLEDLMRLRYEGWPTSCSRCHLPIDHRLGRWWFEHSDDGVLRFTHIECPTLGMSQASDRIPR